MVNNRKMLHKHTKIDDFTLLACSLVFMSNNPSSHYQNVAFKMLLFKIIVCHLSGLEAFGMGFMP